MTVPVGNSSLLRERGSKTPFTCRSCGKTASSRGDLRKHERVHTGERPYVCHTCGKSFTQSSNLRTHERTHAVQRDRRAFVTAYPDNAGLLPTSLPASGGPYQCPTCGKAFLDAGNLRAHERTHTDVQSYECWVMIRAYSSFTLFQLFILMLTLTWLQISSRFFNSFDCCTVENCKKKFIFKSLYCIIINNQHDRRTAAWNM